MDPPKGRFARLADPVLMPRRPDQRKFGDRRRGLPLAPSFDKYEATGACGAERKK